MLNLQDTRRPLHGSPDQRSEYHGVARRRRLGGSGFAATLRDYGRFGQFVLDGGKSGGGQVVPEAWFPDAGLPKLVGSRLTPYGYMWWSEPAGAFRAYGIFGQRIYINPEQRVVIVVWSAQPKPTGSALADDTGFFNGWSMLSGLDSAEANPKHATSTLGL